MSGLSEAAVDRLAALEGKPELESWNRGEVRAMLASRPDAEQKVRLERLMRGPKPGSEVSAPGSEAAASPGSEAFARGLARAHAAAGKRWR